MDQIITALLLFGLATAVIVPVISASWNEISMNSITIADYMEIHRTQTGQILYLISIQQEPGMLSLDLMNIGIYEIAVNEVLVDGITSPYVLTDQYSNPIGMIPLNQVVLLDVTGTGDTVQIISESGKLFEFLL